MSSEKQTYKKRVKKGMAKVAHTQNNVTFYCKDKTSIRESYASHSLWTTWFYKYKAFNNAVDGRSFAQVLKQGNLSRTPDHNFQKQPNRDNGSCHTAKFYSSYRGYKHILDAQNSCHPTTGESNAKHIKQKCFSSARNLRTVNTSPSYADAIQTSNKFQPLLQLSGEEHLPQQISSSRGVGSNHKRKILQKHPKDTIPKAGSYSAGSCSSFPTKENSVSHKHYSSKSHQYVRDESNTCTATAKVKLAASSDTRVSAHTFINRDQPSPAVVLSSLPVLHGEDSHIDNTQHINHTLQDSHIPMLHNKRIPQHIWDNRTECQEYQHCLQQTGNVFGFIPLTPLKLYQGQHIHWDKIPDIIQAHKIVADSPKLYVSQSSNSNTT